MTTLEIETARVFKPLLAPARYKGAWGGRGSGKSHYFAAAAVEACLIRNGLRVLCVREVQRSLRESAKRLIEDKIIEMAVGHRFNVTTERIDTPGGGLIAFQGMQDHNAETIKSFEGFDICWVEEAQTLSRRSLTLLRPTIRKDGSEVWFSWNPRRKSDPVDALLRGESPPPGAIVVKSNWQDNPWFPAALEQERVYDLEHAPDIYPHVWEGDYAQTVAGAYYAASLSEARAHGRIGRLGPDTLLPYYAFWDIGGSGMNADATAIWICQFVGKEIRLLDYYEVESQPLGAHITWLRDNGYGSAICVLPHDGNNHGPITAYTFAEHIRQAGFTAEAVPNQGKGAAMKRIECGRRVFPQCWFDEVKTKPGLEALGAYHEKIDQHREVGLGPNHTWASHGADAFGLMAVFSLAREQRNVPGFSGPITMPKRGVA